MSRAYLGELARTAHEEGGDAPWGLVALRVLEGFLSPSMVAAVLDDHDSQPDEPMTNDPLLLVAG